MAYLYHISLAEFHFRIRAMARRKGGLCYNARMAEIEPLVTTRRAWVGLAAGDCGIATTRRLPPDVM